MNFAELITVSCLASSAVCDTHSECERGHYYDPNTGFCQPCSDCSQGRSGNIYCTRECTGAAKCEHLTYYDPYTERCHTCDDCRPSRTPNAFCLEQCKDYSTTSTTSTTALSASDEQLHTDSTERILTVVFLVVLAIVIVVLTLLVIYFCYARSRPIPGSEGVVYQATPENGGEHLNGISLMVPTGVDGKRPAVRSLPLTLNPAEHGLRSQVTNSSSDMQLLNEHPASTMVLQDETAAMLQQTAASPGRNSCIQLEEESDGEYAVGILRRQSSARLHSSLLGNPVCHPQQEDLGTIAPTLVLGAAEPHVSLDPDKPCCNTSAREHSLTSTNSGHSMSDTLCKSSR